jgi:SAM-dependent methyltransferase
MKKAAEIFDSKYTYFSSYSTSWLAHAKAYVEMMMNRFGFSDKSQVMEIASNDGYLLQYFQEYNVPVLGIEPAANTAEVARKKGIETIVDFFGSQFAHDRLVDNNIKADLIIGNNVLAHVPDINDFVKGLKIALQEDGVITMEFPHLLRLVEECQFDTIYHEHFSYLSLIAVKRIFECQNLELFDVEELPTHGGSLRIFVKHDTDKSKNISSNVESLLNKEKKEGLHTMDYYLNFQERVDSIKYAVWDFLLQQKKAKKTVIGYGAAAKGNTLLNYCGIKGTDLISFVVDASPHKQNKFLPGSRIPVHELSSIEEFKPDVVIVFPWHITKESREQLQYIKDWGGRFVVFVPELKIL